MKKIITLILCLISFIVSVAGTEDKIKAIVYKWNELHNTHQTEEFLQLYAPEVLYYGNTTSKEQCYNSKTKFLNSDFQQQIITPVTLTYYSSGIVKAEFTKRTKKGTKLREHLCYLLLKKFNGVYLITGESDTITDLNKHVELNLGSSKLRPAVLNTIYGLLLLLAAVAFYVWRRKKNSGEETDMHDFTTIPPAVNLSQAPPVAATVTELDQKVITQVKEAVREEIVKLKPVEDIEKKKGDEFERYVIERFDKTYFNLKEWRSDKIHKGIYPESNMNPDLVYDFASNSAKARFAVECKWRADLVNNKIEWAKSYQLDNYRRFQQTERMPVFVVIGVGGQPNNPNDLYIIPLNEINSTYLNAYQLKKFLRYGRSNFFFDPYAVSLR
ncbi:MAG: hypothetical protein QM725_11985 [Lacibacter sp.]